MDMFDYIRFVASLGVVLGLIWLGYWGLKKYAVDRLGLGGGKPGFGARLGVVEGKMLDARHRLVLIRRDNVEHLLLLGAQGDLVIERNIPIENSPPQSGLSFDHVLEQDKIAPSTKPDEELT